MSSHDGKPGSMAKEQIPYVIADHLDLRARKSVCAFHFGKPELGPEKEQIGTATILEHNGELLIVTCEHIASPFFKEPHGLVMIGEGRSHGIPRDRLTPVESDEEDDIALIRLEPDLDTRQLEPRTVDSFRVVRDFRELGGEKYGFAFTGFPGAMVTTPGPTHREIRALTYAGIEYADQPFEEDSIFLGYKDDSEYKEKLAHPGGLSGSAVMILDKLDAKPIWEFPVSVAIVCRRERKRHRYLRCRSLRPLGNWIGVKDF